MSSGFTMSPNFSIIPSGPLFSSPSSRSMRIAAMSRARSVRLGIIFSIMELLGVLLGAERVHDRQVEHLGRGVLDRVAVLLLGQRILERLLLLDVHLLHEGHHLFDVVLRAGGELLRDGRRERGERRAQRGEQLGGVVLLRLVEEAIELALEARLLGPVLGAQPVELLAVLHLLDRALEVLLARVVADVLVARRRLGLRFGRVHDAVLRLARRLRPAADLERLAVLEAVLLVVVQDRVLAAAAVLEGVVADLQVVEGAVEPLDQSFDRNAVVVLFGRQAHQLGDVCPAVALARVHPHAQVRDVLAPLLGVGDQRLLLVGGQVAEVGLEVDRALVRFVGVFGGREHGLL
jgi:hypothetical protein